MRPDAGGRNTSRPPPRPFEAEIPPKMQLREPPILPLPMGREIHTIDERLLGSRHQHARAPRRPGSTPCPRPPFSSRSRSSAPRLRPLEAREERRRDLMDAEGSELRPDGPGMRGRSDGDRLGNLLDQAVIMERTQKRNVRSSPGDEERHDRRGADPLGIDIGPEPASQLHQHATGRQTAERLRSGGQ